MVARVVTKRPLPYSTLLDPEARGRGRRSFPDLARAIAAAASLAPLPETRDAALTLLYRLYSVTGCSNPFRPVEMGPK